MPGILAALIAKLAGLGTVAKAAIATTTAVVTMAVGGAATGVLPLPGGGADPAAIAQDAVDQATSAVGSTSGSLPPTISAGDSVPTADAAVTSPSSPAGASATAATSANVPTPTVPTIPALPAIPSCVANLVPTGATVPNPATLVAQLPACVLSVVTASLPLDTIQSAIGSANLPVDVARCLSSVVGSVPGFAGGNLSGLPELLAACLPTGSFPGMDSIPDMGSFPGMDSIPTGFFPGFPGR